MAELRNGDLLIGTGNGAVVLREDTVIRKYDDSYGFTNNEILCVCEGEDGKLYLGSDGGGLYIVDGDSTSSYSQSDGLLSDVILRVKQDPYHKEIVWIITGNSIAYLQNGILKTLDNFPYSNNFDMNFTSNQKVWILSGNGIYELDYSELMANQPDMQYRLYNVYDGLNSYPVANSRNCCADDGTFYISCGGGVNAINIDGNENADKKAKLTIPYIVVDDQTIYLSDNQKVVIGQDSKYLDIYPYVLSYSLRDSSVSYQLEGLDESATETTGSKLGVVRYMNLDSGDYTFVLSELDQETGEIIGQSRIEIYKEPSFLDSIWFAIAVISCIAAAIVLTIALIMKARNTALIRKQNEREVFISQVIKAFASAIYAKDKYTEGHSIRVAKYTKLIAERMGMKESEVHEAYNIAILHDVGKIAVPDSILNKRGRLTEEEYDIMKHHTDAGYNILKEISSFPEMSIGAKYHHERYDGKGYIEGLEQTQIPLIARIIAVADTFDAMNSTRPYRKKIQLEEIVTELKNIKGSQLDPVIVDIMLQLIEEGCIEDAE